MCVKLSWYYQDATILQLWSFSIAWIQPCCSTETTVLQLWYNCVRGLIHPCYIPDAVILHLWYSCATTLLQPCHVLSTFTPQPWCNNDTAMPESWYKYVTALMQPWQRYINTTILQLWCNNHTVWYNYITTVTGPCYSLDIFIQQPYCNSHNYNHATSKL